MLHELRAIIPALTALIVVAVAAGSAMAQTQSQSGDTVGEPPAPRPKHKPIDLDIEAPSFDFTQDVAKFLNDFHDDYRGFKRELRRDYDLHYSMLVSIFPQWGTPTGGPGVVQLAYDPNILWRPFKNTAVGSGSLTFSMLQTEMGSLRACERCEGNRDPDRDLGHVGWDPQQSLRPQPPRPGGARYHLGQDQSESSGPACPQCGVGDGTLLQLRPLQSPVADP